MNPKETDAKPAAPHGPATEVTWEEGRGRQPYANREVETPPGAAETEAGDRGELSGNHRKQSEEVRGMPP